MWVVSIALLVTAAATISSAADTEDSSKLIFKSCVLPGWSCVNASDGLSSTIASVTYDCSKAGGTHSVRKSRYNPRYGNYEDYYETTGNVNVNLDLSDWIKLPLYSITCRHCQQATLKMHTASPTKIHTLKIEDATTLTLVQPLGDNVHHPQNIAIKNVNYIPVVPTGFIKHDNTSKIELYSVTIGLLQKGAISVNKPLETFEWNHVKTIAMKEKAISVEMQKHSQFHIRNSIFPYMKPLSIMVQDGGSVLIEDSYFEILQEASMRLTAAAFNFTQNRVQESAGPIYVLSPDVTVLRNVFERGSLKNMMNWTYTSSVVPEQISLVTINNTFVPIVRNPREDPPKIDNSCRSQVLYLRPVDNCTEISYKPGSWIYDPPSNLAMMNVLLCGNTCGIQHNCETPDYWWNPAKVWPQPVCKNNV